MKKLTFLALIISVISIQMNAQISLDRSFEGTSELSGIYSFFQIKENIPASKTIGYLELTNDFNVTLYDSIYQPIGTQFGIADQASGYEIKKILFASSHMFDTDDGIEFIVVYKDPNSERAKGIYFDNGVKTTTVFDGAQVYLDFNFDYAVIGSKLKLIVSYRNKNTTTDPISYVTYTDIYDLGGTVSTILGVAPTQLENKYTSALAYPNPTNDFINIQYSNIKENTDLYIYSVSGKLIEMVPLRKDKNNVQLDVSFYDNGTYIYRYNNVASKFIVNKN